MLYLAKFANFNFSEKEANIMTKMRYSLDKHNLNYNFKSKSEISVIFASGIKKCSPVFGA